MRFAMNAGIASVQAVTDNYCICMSFNLLMCFIISIAVNL